MPACWELAWKGGPLQLPMTLYALRVYNEQENFAILILPSYHHPERFPEILVKGKSGTILDIGISKKVKIVVKSMACIHTNADT
jgi:hypothetical protein